MSTIYQRVVDHLRVATGPVAVEDLVEVVYPDTRPANPVSCIRVAICKGNSRSEQVGYYASGYVLNRRRSTFIRADRLADIDVPEVDDQGRQVPVRLRVLSALAQAPRPLTAVEVADVVYRNRADGGPLHARGTVAQAILRLRKAGAQIGSIKGRRGGYAIERAA